MKKFAILGVSALAGCSSVNAQYVGPDGRYGTGAVTGGALSLNNGKFSIAAQGVTCSGNFPSWEKRSIVFPVWCTDGVSGTVTMTRAPVNVIAGEGTMQLTNGETRRFTFG